MLLFGYLVSVVIMLLNVLIAMMSKSYDLVTEVAEEQYLLHKAEAILQIERSLSLSDRENQYAVLKFGNQDAKESVTTPTDTDSRNGTIQTKDRKVRSSGEELDDGMNEAFVDEPLDWSDGKKFIYAKDMIRRPSSASIEMRFDSQDATASVSDSNRSALAPLKSQQRRTFSSSSI